VAAIGTCSELRAGSVTVTGRAYEEIGECVVAYGVEG
jgi:hypothetical protein